MIHVNGGRGESSYASNSLLPRKVISMTWPIAKEAITNFLCGSATNFPTTLSIADMGCSSGPNSLFFVSNLIQQVEHLRKEFHKPPLEYQVLLNDLHGNDFNAIFTSLPSLLESLNAQVGGCLGPCFFSGVPGSFYGRLFPAKSLHFVYSSYSLHWLSQVPKGIESNKGNTFIGSSTPKSVLEAYYTQFHKDFSMFLKCRAEEGLVEAEKVDAFNIPNYMPSPSELKAHILNEGSFSIHCVEVSRINWNFYATEFQSSSTTTSTSDSAYLIAKNIRSVAEPLLIHHFGEAIMEELFCRYTKLVDDHMLNHKIEFVNLTASLTKMN
ncbi:Salicylate carboxymethyltransferase, partial [Cucurbita argyrosperma subsp. sororia]